MANSLITNRPASRPRTGPDRAEVVLVQSPLGSSGLTGHKVRLRDRALAHGLGASLDKALASGRAPEDGPLLALRAQSLVSPTTRQNLARSWERVVDMAFAPWTGTSGHARLCRQRVVEAQAEIGALVTSLRASAPVPARGVAMASALLHDGTGPLYNPRCHHDLRTAVVHAATSMYPDGPPVT